MYRKNEQGKTTLSINNSVEGETIEMKIERIVNNKEPITDGAPIVYSERNEGVVAAYDIRTDRWEVAIDAMDKVAATHKAKREERAKILKESKNKKDGTAESTQGQAAESADQA